MKELSDLNKNNTPMQVMIFNGPVNIVQASNDSTVKIESQTKKRKGLISKIVKAIIGLVMAAMFCYLSIS